LERWAGWRSTSAAGPRPDAPRSIPQGRNDGENDLVVTREESKVRLLITGARGMMGRDLSALAEAAGHEIWTTDVARLVHDPEDSVDVADFDGLGRAFDTFRPEAVLHLAAMTNVDDCERFPEQAYAVNTVGTRNVALHCRRRDIELLYISTGSVFDGTKTTPYHEFDDPNPLSVYSRSKWQGERAVRDLVPRHYVVRAGWMFGGGAEDKKFVAKMIDLARERDVLRAVDDKFGSPCYTRDISARCLELLATGRYGTYHAANEGFCSRYEMAAAIVEAAGVDTCRVEPCSSAEFPLPAPRPRWEVITGLHARLIGLAPMRGWREALREYVQSTFA
jgi:dTDP-4-dehydrorhamnose reductase